MTKTSHDVQMERYATTWNPSAADVLAAQRDAAEDAADEQAIEELRQQIDALKARIAELKSPNGEDVFQALEGKESK